MLDCWKNSCHGATVVPTIAMIKSTAVEVIPPRAPGIKNPRTIGPAWGWTRITSGMARKFTATKMNMKRSQLRKLPVAVMAINPSAAMGTEMSGDMPK